MPLATATAGVELLAIRSSSGVESQSGRGQDDAVDAVRDQLARHLRLVLSRLALLDHQLGVGDAGAVQHAHEERVQVPRAGLL
jgi:hypothetical protein